MQPFPHRYLVTAVAGTESEIILQSDGLTAIRSALPAEFGGAGDRWSPETLLVAAVADCFTLTFRGVARASRLEWTSLTCEVAGTLDRVDGVSRFTHFELRVQLQLPEGSSEALAHRVMAKAEQTCLVTRSMTATTELIAAVETVTAQLV